MALHCVFNSVTRANAGLAAVDAALGMPRSVPVGEQGTRQRGRGPSHVVTASYSAVCVSPDGSQWSFVITQDVYAALPGASLGLPAPVTRTERWELVE